VAGWLQAVVVIAAVGVLHVPLGDYMARTFSSVRHWRPEAPAAAMRPGTFGRRRAAAGLVKHQTGGCCR